MGQIARFARCAVTAVFRPEIGDPEVATHRLGASKARLSPASIIVVHRAPPLYIYTQKRLLYARRVPDRRIFNAGKLLRESALSTFTGGKPIEPAEGPDRMSRRAWFPRSSPMAAVFLQLWGVLQVSGEVPDPFLVQRQSENDG